MSNSQETDVETAKPADEASTPVATSEQKGITAVSEALKSVFGDLEPDNKTTAAAPSSASGKASDAGGDDGLSAGDIDDLLAKLEEPAPEGEKGEKPKTDDTEDPFAKIEENWDSDVAKVMREQAARIAELEQRIAGTPAPKPAPNALEKHLTETLGSSHALVKPETIGSFARLVDKTALPVAKALAAARPPQTPEEHAAIEKEAIDIVVARMTNKQAPAKREQAPKTIPPGGNAGAPSAHRSAQTNAEKGAAAIARAMATLG